MSRAALSQQLKALERQLNVRLLHRTTRDMSLTEEGQRLFDSLSPALATIERAVRELGESNAEPSGNHPHQYLARRGPPAAAPAWTSSWPVIRDCGWSW
ncbi:LysR family transcriptional regulator [Achromobacter insuavis]